MKSLIAFVCLLPLSISAWTQPTEMPQRPFQRLIIEASVTGFPQKRYEDLGTGQAFNFFENSAHLSLLTNVSKYWLVGFNYNYLWTRFKQRTTDNYFLAGLTVRYDRPLGKKFRIYGDIQPDAGNYCPCIKEVGRDNMPYKIDKSFYLGLGVGGSFNIYKSIWLNLALNSYDLINNKHDSYGYIQPILGIQIHEF